MKKKIFMITIAVFALAAAVSALVITRGISRTFGSMSSSFSSPKTESSSFSFAAEAGDRVRITFSSDIKSGDLTVTLYNSYGEVKTLDSAKALQTYWNIEKADTYTLRADCTEMVGSYKLKATKA